MSKVKMENEMLTADEWSSMNADKMAAANKKAIEDILEKVLPKHDLQGEIRHWHRSFISSSMCSGKSVAESIEDANDAITSLYGALDFELITQK